MPRIIPFKISLFFLLLVAASSTVNADDINARATGLTSPQTTIDFGDGLLADGIVITTQFQGDGVTFSTTGFPWNYRTAPTPFNGISAGHLFTGGSPDSTYSIQFSGPVTEAAFTLKAFPRSWTLTALRNDAVVGSFAFTAAGDGTPTGTVRNYGFENITFDTLTLVRSDAASPGAGFEFDNLQFSLLTLIHRFTFDGTTVVDSVGTATGTLVNGASLAGGSLVLDGVNDYVQVNQKIVPTGASPFSVTLFAQQLSAQAGTHVEMISQGSSNGLGFYIGHRPFTVFADRNIRVTDQFLNTGVPFPSDGLFHCYALTSDGNGTRFFIDSIQVFASGTQLTPDNTGIGTRFGRQFPNFNEFFHGLIDDVQVYSGALSGAEITALCDALTSQLVDIDIKPGSDPNGVNPRSKGVIPVAVLGSVDFDATQVDLSTVSFGPDAASPVHDGHVENVNGDGFADRVFHFRSRDTGIACGDTDATLTGEIFAGAPFTGTDAVKTAGCK